MSESFSLSSVLSDHTDQVRGVCSFPPIRNGIITCSVDRTVKLWQEMTDEDLNASMVDDTAESRYELLTTMIGHTNFVISVSSIARTDDSGRYDIVSGENTSRRLLAIDYDITKIYCLQILLLFYFRTLLLLLLKCLTIRASSFGILKTGLWCENMRMRTRAPSRV